MRKCTPLGRRVVCVCVCVCVHSAHWPIWSQPYRVIHAVADPVRGLLGNWKYQTNIYSASTRAAPFDSLPTPPKRDCPKYLPSNQSKPKGMRFYGFQPSSFGLWFTNKGIPPVSPLKHRDEETGTTLRYRWLRSSSIGLTGFACERC